MVQAPRAIFAAPSLANRNRFGRNEIRTALQELGFTDTGEIEGSPRLERMPCETQARWQRHDVVLTVEPETGAITYYVE